MDGLFNKAVSEYLKENPELKSKWDSFLQQSDENISNILDIQKFQGKIDETIEEDNSFSEPSPEPEIIEVENDSDSDSDKFFKAIYREIVKITHPDKITHLSEEERESRNKIYIDSTDAYDKKILADILYCAYILKIPFEVKQDDIKTLKESLHQNRMQSNFLEKTYTWQWYHSNDDIKNHLLNDFIVKQVNNL